MKTRKLLLLAGTMVLGVSFAADAQVAPEPSRAEILLDLTENSMSAEEIRSTASFSSIKLVDLDSVRSGGPSEALQKVLRDTEDGWAEVQTAIEANELLERELNRRQVAIGRVVAATMDDVQSITIYFR